MGESESSPPATPEPGRRSWWYRWGLCLALLGVILSIVAWYAVPYRRHVDQLGTVTILILRPGDYVIAGTCQPTPLSRGFGCTPCDVAVTYRGQPLPVRTARCPVLDTTGTTGSIRYETFHASRPGRYTVTLTASETPFSPVTIKRLYLCCD